MATSENKAKKEESSRRDMHEPTPLVPIRVGASGENEMVDYLCVLDFEATCDDKRRPRPQEIIEFPALLLDTRTKSVAAKFHYYVMPDVHPVSSCRQSSIWTERRQFANASPPHNRRSLQSFVRN